MDILTWSQKQKKSIHVSIDFSIMHEAALGIAAITNKSLLNTLEKESEFKKLRKRLSSSLQQELNFIEKNNTWKSLLLLLHAWNIQHMEEFENMIQEVSNETLRFEAMPFIGNEFEVNRLNAAKGESKSIAILEESTSSFLPGYIRFIASCDTNKLKRHLVRVLRLWLEEVIYPEQENLESILARDVNTKRNVQKHMDSTRFIQWVLDDNQFTIDNTETNILVIPHMTYRPWVIYLETPHYQVLYYPVSNDSVYPEDKYVPDYRMLQAFKMIGDDTRLRILKLLSDQDLSLTQLADKLNQGKTSLHHHLKLLRSARIIETHQLRYRLNQEALYKNWAKLEDYLNDE